MPKDKLHIHVTTIENGYILKDLTDQKDKDSPKPKTYVATSMKDLKDRINTLVDDRLESQKPVGATVPNNAFNRPGGM